MNCVSLHSTGVVYMLCILGAAFVEHNWYIFGAVWQSIIGRFLSISHSPLLIQDIYEGGAGGGGYSCRGLGVAGSTCSGVFTCRPFRAIKLHV